MIIELKIVQDTLVIALNESGGMIESALQRELCPSCNFPDCNASCDGSQGADESNDETEDDIVDRLKYNAALDLLESIILAHAIAGVNVKDPAYVQGVEVGLEALGNNI